MSYDDQNFIGETGKGGNEGADEPPSRRARTCTNRTGIDRSPRNHRHEPGIENGAPTTQPPCPETLPCSGNAAPSTPGHESVTAEHDHRRPPWTTARPPSTLVRPPSTLINTAPPSSEHRPTTLPPSEHRQSPEPPSSALISPRQTSPRWLARGTRWLNAAWPGNRARNIPERVKQACS